MRASSKLLDKVIGKVIGKKDMQFSWGIKDFLCYLRIS